jgi:hypothetical protein
MPIAMLCCEAGILNLIRRIELEETGEVDLAQVFVADSECQMCGQVERNVRHMMIVGGTERGNYIGNCIWIDAYDLAEGQD